MPLVFAPTVSEKVPAAHATHAALPRSVLNVPAAHNSHDAPSAPNAPAEHEQFKREPEAAAEKEFAGHGWQSGLPLSDHVPGGHGKHDSMPTAPAAE
ncbi:MAG: hypothetical protein EBR09_14435 [Proteobacteria bacterium]|nr:hypothetical protein [Pseudomonadota bacterium]